MNLHRSCWIIHLGTWTGAGGMRDDGGMIQGPWGGAPTAVALKELHREE